VRQPNSVISRPAGGVRTIEAHRPGNTTVVVHAAHGYVQRPVVAGGTRFFQRTYVVNNVTVVRAYRPILVAGVPLYVYAPAFYYPAPLYVWAAAPWVVPVAYPWPWGAAPWLAFYGPYFAPLPVYSSPAMWLTDYLLARTLEEAFAARSEEQDPASAAQAPSGSTPISADIKSQIAEEVRKQLQEEQGQGGTPWWSEQSSKVLPPSLSDGGPHLFVASDTIDVKKTAGESCLIGEGDAIQMKGGLPRAANANVVVLASKQSSCPAGSSVMVPIADLVEMHNSMREKLDSGLEQLRSEQGTSNLPTLPQAAMGGTVATPFASSLRPDPDAAQMIHEEARRADMVEQRVLADSGTILEDRNVGADRQATGPLNNRQAEMLEKIRVGQSEGEVIVILGQPMNSSFLGGLKKMYEYAAGKVIFTDGTVSEVQVLATDGVRPAPAQEAAVDPIDVASPATRPAQPTSSSSKAQVSVGLSESEVVAILGEPLRISFLGGVKKLYDYPGRKVIFTDGNVSEVQ